MTDCTIKSIEEVKKFLEEAKKLALDRERRYINNEEWANGRVNKTRLYIAETQISLEHIWKVISELQVNNYSSTKKDVNPNFPNEEVWIFGIKKVMVDELQDLYIKLKIRRIESKFLLLMSFHPEMPSRENKKLTFPYKDFDGE